MALCCCGRPSWFFLAADVLHQPCKNNCCSCSAGSPYPSSFKDCRSPPLLSGGKKTTALHANANVSARSLLYQRGFFCNPGTSCNFFFGRSPFGCESAGQFCFFSFSLDWIGISGEGEASLSLLSISCSPQAILHFPPVLLFHPLPSLFILSVHGKSSKKDGGGKR